MLRLVTLFALTCSLHTAALFAQDFPSKTVKVIFPNAPGGGVDALARAYAEQLTRRWKQTVIVENRPGASTLIGTEAAARSAPDGYTILLTSDTSITSNPHIFKKMAFDPMKDLIPVALLVYIHQTVVAHPSVPVSTIADVVTLAKQKPDTLTYASYGSGTQAHLLYEVLKSETGTQIRHIPYKGIAAALAATTAGEVALTTGGFTSIPLIREGRLKALAVASVQRLPALPNVPTLKEAGYPNIDPKAWVGVFAPSGTPSSIIGKIHADMSAISNDEEFHARNIGGNAFAKSQMSTAEFAQFVREDFEYKGRMIRIAGVVAE
jgi:tripartite-type tricarboxylate transporter receptor subunit TctC